MDETNHTRHRKSANENMKDFYVGKCSPVMEKKPQVNAAPDCKILHRIKLLLPELPCRVLILRVMAPKWHFGVALALMKVC